MIRLVVASVLVLASVAPAFANQIQVGFGTASNERYGPYQAGLGGEFTLAIVSGDDLTTSAYADETSGFGSISSFQSFCIEMNEYLNPYSATYDVTLGAAATGGGIDGGNPDPVSQGTAYLYSQFAQGLLTDPAYTYSYTGTTAQRKASAAQLQEAIWWLENELTTYAASNPFMALVVTTFGSATEGRLDATGDRYGVHVLHLTTGSGGPAQDQLYFAGLSDAEPVPDGGMTMTLLGMGLLGLAAGRRYLAGRV